MLLILALTTATAAATPALPLPLPPPLPIAEAVKGALAAVGADPSWNLQIVDDKLTLTESIDDDENIEDFKLVSSEAQGETAHVWKAGALTVSISAAACSDGVQSYPYTSELKITGKKARTLKGCAYRPWGQDVIAALPVIDACLAQGANKPVVVYAGATAADAGVVMLAGGEENPLSACTVTGGKASVVAFEGGDWPPGTNAEIFVRGPGENPGGECYDAPEVKDGAGRVVGWWLDPAGC
jgi:uncharacterized membrane protein